MDLASLLDACASGLASTFAPASLIALCVGVVVGALVGILPGLGGPAAIAILLPMTFTRPPGEALALLIGIIAATSTTGDLTSILLGIPGEPTAAATVLDGHPLARRGEAGRAIGASLISSLAGALVGVMVFGAGIALARPLSRTFGSPEYFVFAVVGVCLALPLTSASRAKGAAMGALGFALATVGLDPSVATPRFTFGELALWDGIGLIPAALGLFAIPEIVTLMARASIAPALRAPAHAAFREGVRDVRKFWPVVVRSSLIGAGVGLMPGLGGTVSQWMAYAQAEARSPHARDFGRGAIEGVIAPSAANNATLGGALVPTLALGIPGSVSAALLLSALVMKGIVPGPQLLLPEEFGGHLTFVFTLAWMIVMATVLATALSWSAIGSLVRVTRVRSSLLTPMLFLLVFVGAFTERHLFADLLITAIFGVAGVAFARYNWPRTPMLIGLVLGPIAENRLFLSMDAYGTDWLFRPVVLLAAALLGALWIRRSDRRSGRGASTFEDVTPAADRGAALTTLTLLAVGIAALIMTEGFPGRAALFPRLVLACAVVTLGIVFARDLMTRRLAVSQLLDTQHAVPLRAAGRILFFLAIIWALGFPAGAPVAVLGSLLIDGRERLGPILGLTLLAYVLVAVVMTRLLQIPFPSGAALAWMGVQ